MAELNLLQKKILADGIIKSGDVLKVDSFLNHQIDVPFISELGKIFKKLFASRPVTKILPELKCGICGEHGGDPSSVEFCHKVGLNYVSCSPFRVPIARLAAAQAALHEKGYK